MPRQLGGGLGAGAGQLGGRGGRVSPAPGLRLLAEPLDLAVGVVELEQPG